MSERWERLTGLFHAAVTLPPEERTAFLTRECAGDHGLLAELERLLSAHDRAGGFIATSPVALEEPSLAGRRLGPYRIVEELGRGGMGAVYLAERADGQYQQRVAIKLIKRGMDSDLVLQRFRAERQILASLEHPHIARLLDGGTTGAGRPYFVMEYVAGEPIDQFADARRLSLAERLRLFLGVCGAVAYAHDRRVIHRDLKPVNILVTAEGSPKLLDFGIARVLEPGAEEPTASLTGSRLLTPEYASPEQVEGRHATQSSDVYSLGVVLYELLTGRSPYQPRSRDPLAVLEAVRTTDPERPSRAVVNAGAPEHAAPRRAGLESDRAAARASLSTARLGRQLRGDLDTIVLSALQKDPARRYASVELLAEDIRRHLNGLPVRARRDGVRYRAGKFLRRNRPSVLAASLAGGIVLLGGAGLLALRAAADRREGPSLVATGALAQRDRILVAEFADLAGDSALVTALTDAFRDELTQSPFVRVVSPRQVRSTLMQMERSPDLVLDDSLAREVAVRGNVKAIVTGSVSRVAGRYTISSRLTSATKGDLLAAFRETASDSNDVIRAVDRLAERLRRRIGEALASVRATPPLEQVTTASLSALRSYSEGTRVIASGDRDRGVRLLENAVTLDTGFASAYRVLGVTYGDLVELGRGRAAVEHALANQARLPFYERNHTIATHAYVVLGDYQAAIDAYHRILERYPDDVRALNNLGYVHSLRREFAVQESLLVRATLVDSTIPSIYTGLTMAQANNGDLAAARRTLDQVERRFPQFSNARLSEIYLPAAAQDWETAERKARDRLTSNAADSLDSLDGLETLAGIVMTRGRLAESEQESRQVLALSARLGSPGRYLSSALRLAYLELRFRNRSSKALDIVDAALRRFRLDSLREGDRPYGELARLFAVAGEPARARELMKQAAGTDLGRRRLFDAERRWTLGVIAFSEGRLRDAQVDLSEAVAINGCPICVLPDLARTYELIGKPDSAIAVYERYLRLPWEWRFETDAIELGWTLKRLGELYRLRGEPAKAISVNTRLLQLWGQADPSLQPVLEIVRRRLAELGAVPSS